MAYVILPITEIAKMACSKQNCKKTHVLYVKKFKTVMVNNLTNTVEPV